MYNNVGPQPGVPRPPTNPQPTPFGNAFYGAGSGLIKGGLGAYGEKILGSSSEYVQSNVSSTLRLSCQAPFWFKFAVSQIEC
jgi:hypothetical protein